MAIRMGGTYDSYYGGTDYGYGYPSGGYEGSYYGGTGYENGYPTHSRVAELQRRLARAGYYSFTNRSRLFGHRAPSRRHF